MRIIIAHGPNGTMAIIGLNADDVARLGSEDVIEVGAEFLQRFRVTELTMTSEEGVAEIATGLTERDIRFVEVSLRLKKAGDEQDEPDTPEAHVAEVCADTEPIEDAA